MRKHAVRSNKDFLQCVGDVMDDDVFKEFFETYFNNWDDVISAVMLMKAYQSLNKQCPDMSNHELVEALRNYMKNHEFRHNLANGMVSFMRDHKSNTVKMIEN